MEASPCCARSASSPSLPHERGPRRAARHWPAGGAPGVRIARPGHRRRRQRHRPALRLHHPHSRPAGHDQFATDQMYAVLGAERGRTIERFGCLHNALLNMTYLALRFSRYVNGVSMEHGKVSQQMFPSTASTPSPTESTPQPGSPSHCRPARRRDSRVEARQPVFRSIYGVSLTRIANCHAKSKQRLLDEVACAPASSSTPMS